MIVATQSGVDVLDKSFIFAVFVLTDRQGFISPELAEKKVIAERQPSKIGTPVFASNISNVHYPQVNMPSIFYLHVFSALWRIQFC